MSDISKSTQFLIDWFLSGPEYLLESALFHAHWAVTGVPEDQKHHLADLECWTVYHWNFASWESVSDHTRSLRETLIYDDIEAADWLQVAEALVKASPRKD